MDRIVIFEGSKSDFNKMLQKENARDTNFISYMELIQLYNVRIRQSGDNATGNSLMEKKYYETCIVNSDDYGSVLENAINNFINTLTLNTDFSTVYIHNPPKKVVQSLESEYSDIITYDGTEYLKIERCDLGELYKHIGNEVLGQKRAKEEIITNLLAHSYIDNDKPKVLMFYGPSGVGKTETAKSLSKYLGGELMRIQFSMMQSDNAIDYVFGSEHSRTSLARDLYSRETNIILIDEFDKVNNVFYNAFYELFDEGRFVDPNYKIILKDAIFILTTNFQNEDEIRKKLGMPIFSRIDSCIEYSVLNNDDKIKIIEEEYIHVFDQLDPEDKEIIEKSNILTWFTNNSSRYDNIRLLKTRVENAIFEILASEIINNSQKMD